MANTIVSFTTNEGEILANLSWLPLATGDTITFEAPVADAPQPVIFFSPDLVSILEPTPPENLTIGSAAELVFTVSAAQPGAYTIAVGASTEYRPFFPERTSINLFFQSTPIPVGTTYDPPVRSGS